MSTSVLDIVAVYANPIRWKSRLQVHQAFERQILATPLTRLTTVECVYGEADWQLPDDPRINRVRVRAYSLLWHKENLINIGISRLPEGWKYVGWIDADIVFRDPEWTDRAIHELQHHLIIQPWTHAYDLGPKGQHMNVHQSFASLYVEGQPVIPTGPKFWKFSGGPYEYSHTGYAWCATRQAIEWLGGLFDLSIMGEGDNVMARAFLGKATTAFPGNVHPSYKAAALRWEQRAVQHVKGDIGALYGTVEHLWHGRKADRKYVDRWDIVTSHQVNPDADLKRNSYGVLELIHNKPELEQDIHRYFRSRDEDANVL